MTFADTEYGDLSGKDLSDTNFRIDFRADCEITSLKGSPKYTKDFIVSHNSVISLEGCPEKVFGDLVLSYNKNLTSLEYCAKDIEGSLIIEGIKRFKNKKELTNIIIKNQIKGKNYLFGKKCEVIYFKDIKEEFEKYGEHLNNLEKEAKNKIIQEEKTIRALKIKESRRLSSQDFGLGI